MCRPFPCTVVTLFRKAPTGQSPTAAGRRRARSSDFFAARNARFGVARLTVFGSVARDEAVQGGDVDLLVEFDRPIGLFSFLELQNHFEVLLGCAVDLGTPRSLKPRMRARVLAEAVNVA